MSIMGFKKRGIAIVVVTVILTALCTLGIFAKDAYMVGSALDEELAAASMQSDSGELVATYFSLRDAGYLTGARYYFPNGFIESVGGDYTYDFEFTLWDKTKKTAIETRKVNATVTSDGWYTFKFDIPFEVTFGKTYGLSVNKGVSCYSFCGERVNGDFDYKTGNRFNLPSGGFGAVGSSDEMPETYYSVNGGSFFGVDPIFDADYSLKQQLIGDRLDGKLGGYGTDAGASVATYFVPNLNGYITEARYYFPDGFVASKGGSYTYDFIIQLWDKNSGGLIGQRVIPATVKKDGWHTFTLENPFKVTKGKIYGVSVYKGTNGYITYGCVEENSYDGIIGSAFSLPNGGFGAWGTSASEFSIPTNSYELRGGIFWGVDVTFSTEGKKITTKNVGWPSDVKVVTTAEGTRITVDDEIIIPFWSYGYSGPNDNWRYFETIKYSAPSQRCVYMLSTGFDFSSEATKEGIRETMNTLLEIDPDALVIWRGSAFAAGEWSEQDAVPYEGDYDLAKRYDGSNAGAPIGLGWLSMSSDRWRMNIQDNYTKGVEWMATEAFATHVIGFQPGNATTFEWVFVTNDDGRNPDDYSGAARDKFRLWLEEKYVTVDRLRRAWKDNNVTFETAEIPNPTERLSTDNGYFLTVEGGSAKVIDYNQFYNESYADAMIFISDLVKTLTNDRLLTGYLYGYYFSYIRWGFPVQCGAYALTKVLESGKVDLLFSTNDYWSRALGDMETNTSVVDSYHLNNMVFVAEDDTRTYLSPAGGDNEYRAPDFESTLAVLRRNFAYFAVRDAGSYWMDMAGTGWYNDADLWESLNEMRRTWAVMNYQTADNGFMPDVAYVVDDESLYYAKAANDGYAVYVDEQGWRFASAGVSYGTYLKCDLDKLPESVKVIFVANSYYVDDEDIANFNALKSDGRTIVWMRAPGYITPSGASVDNISALTGFNISSISGNDGRTNITNSSNPFVAGSASSYGYSYNQKPAFYVNDSSATELGVYRNTSYVSFAVKNMGNWTSIFSGSVVMPPSMIRAICLASGVHSYTTSTQWDGVETDHHFLSYIASGAGTRTVSLPQPSHVVNMITGETIGNNISSFTFNTRYDGDINFFSITAGSATCLDVTSDSVSKTFGWQNTDAGLKSLNPGEKLAFTFTGTFVSINAPKGPGYGVIKVKIDGMEYPDVNLNTRAVDNNPNAEIVLAHGLENRVHTVELEIGEPIDYSTAGGGFDTSTPHRNTTHGDEVPAGYTNNASGDNTQYNMGIKFAVKIPGKITHARLLAVPKSNGLHEVTLWKCGDRSIIAGPYSWDLQTDKPAWCEFELPTPVEIEAGVDYMMTIASKSGKPNYYWSQGQFFPVKNTNSVIITYSDSGAFKGGTDGYPTLTFNSSSYGRDIVFSFADTDTSIDLSGSDPNGSSIMDGVDISKMPGLDGSDEELSMGVKFKVKVNGAITKAKLIADSVSNGLHKVTLYDHDSRKVIAGPYDWNVNVSNRCWAEYTFATPIVIEKDTWYVLEITSLTGKNYYAYSEGYFSTLQPDNSVFVTDTTSGRFAQGTNAFPSMSYNARSYGRDLEFVYDATGSGKYDSIHGQYGVEINSVNVVGEFGTPPVIKDAIDWTCGDVNLDGDVDVLDILTVKRYLQRNLILTEQQIAEADVDRSGIVDQADLEGIMRIIYK